MMMMMMMISDIYRAVLTQKRRHKTLP